MTSGGCPYRLAKGEAAHRHSTTLKERDLGESLKRLLLYSGVFTWNLAQSIWMRQFNHSRKTTHREPPIYFKGFSLDVVAISRYYWLVRVATYPFRTLEIIPHSQSLSGSGFLLSSHRLSSHPGKPAMSALKLSCTTARTSAGYPLYAHHYNTKPNINRPNGNKCGHLFGYTLHSVLFENYTLLGT